MKPIRSRVVSNYAGQLWVAALGLALLPRYLEILGPEAFGLVGVMYSLQAVALVLDSGISVFIGREIAVRLARPGDMRATRSLVHTFEVVVWLLAGLILASLALAGVLLGPHILETQSIEVEDLQFSLLLVAASVALSWPSGYYAAALSGAERQHALNALLAAFATLRYGGALAVLYFPDATVDYFLAWFAVSGLLQSLAMALVFWRGFPQPEAGKTFDLAGIRHGGAFATGVFAVTALGIATSQLDRALISILMPLPALGMYVLVAGLGSGLGRIVQPLFNVVYPRMSQHAASGGRAELAILYRASLELITVLMAVAACVVAVLPDLVLLAWTGDKALAAELAIPLALFFAGSAINGVLNIPYALHLSHAKTRTTLALNLVLLIAFVPVYLALIDAMGLAGAALGWLLLNLSAFAFMSYFGAARILPSAGLASHLGKLTFVVAAALAGALLVHQFVPESPDRIAATCLVLAALAISGALACLASQEARSQLSRILRLT